jgi:acetyl esterase/lipase
MFKDVTLFTGTHEFFYPDIIRFSHKLDEANIKNRVLVGEGLNHVYPIIPSPEGETAINIIGDLIENNNVAV